ncbi:hypothetical protein [Cobetia sp. 1AS1]|uniref:hypothetical protein n=1 Tax=Cobetia sp. 1AS1 TaxID=3040016 RepID=UPI002449F122|nr:hypothetical protein [Cobetia sp. 1AS1]MDH2296005.1 hypothetical protein [Cobetia sp. 1AS1]
MTIESIEPFIVLIRDGATIFFYIIGCWVALSGLRTWKKQLVGESKYEALRRLIRLTYRLQQQIRNIRGSYRQSLSSIASEDYKDSYFKTSLESMDEQVVEIKELVFELKLMDKGFNDQSIQELLTIAEEFKMSIFAYVIMSRIDISGKPQLKTREREERLKEVRAIIYSSKDNDEFGKRLNDVVGEVESSLSRYLNV